MTTKQRVCARFSCPELSIEPHRRSNGLCRAHAKERREKQRRTAESTKCACGNVATFGHSDCGGCRGKKELIAETGTAEVAHAIIPNGRPGAMNRPTKNDQDCNGMVWWWDSWNREWWYAPYSGCKHADRYTHWKRTGLKSPAPL